MASDRRPDADRGRREGAGARPRPLPAADPPSARHWGSDSNGEKPTIFIETVVQQAGEAAAGGSGLIPPVISSRCSGGVFAPNRRRIREWKREHLSSLSSGSRVDFTIWSPS